MQQDKADRRPETPRDPLDLAAAGDELLEQAGQAGPGRSARNLTPGEGSPLSQTLVALTGGSRLNDHVTNGPATLQVLRGSVTLTTADGDVGVEVGHWATVPREEHGLIANDDSVVLLTVAPVQGH